MFRFVFYLLLFVFLGRYVNCDAGRLTYGLVVGPTLCEKNLYLDSNLALHDVLIIKSAADEWEEATNGKVRFNFIDDFHAENLSKIPYNKNNVFVVAVDEDSEMLKKYDSKSSQYILGYFDNDYDVPVIVLVPSRVDSFLYYRAVVIHEMGHSIGLRHSKKEGTIMYPVADMASWYITDSDLADFCRNYYCGN